MLNSKFIFLLFLLLIVAGCARSPVNPPLHQYDPDAGYRLKNLVAKDNSPTLLVILTFSGGGTRAAALSYGVLEELARIETKWEGHTRRLLDEVDIIAGVSGGSFTAAYFGLYGDRIFFEFEDRFLKKNVQGALTAKLFNPVNWVRLLSRHYGRSELAAKYYDKHLFHGATFNDFLAVRGPLISINATDMTLGGRFGFDQTHFDWLCSDLLRFPISRAIAASSAVPVALSPVTMYNYAGSCGFRPPADYERVLATPDWGSRRYHAFRRMATYLDRANKPFLHLVDGGLSDNLGLRAIMESVILAGGAPEILQQRGLTEVRKVLFVVVNAQTEGDPSWDKRERVPSIMTMISILTKVPLNEHNFETISLLRTNVSRWAKRIAEARCAPEIIKQGRCELVEFFLVDVNFQALADEQEREYLQRLPTKFKLPGEDVDRVRTAAALLLRESGAFQRFLRDLRLRPALP